MVIKIFVNISETVIPIRRRQTQSRPRDPRVFSVVPLHLPLPDAMLLHLRQTYNGTEACSRLQQLHSRA